MLTVNPSVYLDKKFPCSHDWTDIVIAVADPGFSPGGAPTPKIAIIFHIFAENCMKMKEFGPPGGGARPWRPPLDPPMNRSGLREEIAKDISSAFISDNSIAFAQQLLPLILIAVVTQWFY